MHMIRICVCTMLEYLYVYINKYMIYVKYHGINISLAVGILVYVSSVDMRQHTRWIARKRLIKHIHMYGVSFPINEISKTCCACTGIYMHD